MILFRWRNVELDEYPGLPIAPRRWPGLERLSPRMATQHLKKNSALNEDLWTEKGALAPSVETLN